MDIQLYAFLSGFNRETGINVTANDPDTSPSPSVVFFFFY